MKKRNNIPPPRFFFPEESPIPLPPADESWALLERQLDELPRPRTGRGWWALGGICVALLALWGALYFFSNERSPKFSKQASAGTTTPQAPGGAAQASRDAARVTAQNTRGLDSAATAGTPGASMGSPKGIYPAAASGPGGRASTGRGSAPAAHGSGPTAPGDAPIARGSAPTAHEGVPATHGSGPTAPGDVPVTHGSAPTVSGGGAWRNGASDVAATPATLEKELTSTFPAPPLSLWRDLAAAHYSLAAITAGSPDTAAGKAGNADSAGNAANTANGKPAKKPRPPLRITAGLALLQNAPLGNQVIYGYNINGKANLVSDYIPAPYIQYFINRRLYLEIALKWNSPQYIPATPIDSPRTEPGYKQTVFTTSTLQKLYYTDIPVTIGYAPLPHLFLGGGIQYSGLRGGFVYQRVVSYDSVSLLPLVYRTGALARGMEQTLQLRTTDWRILLEASYYWNRFTLGLRYQQALNSLDRTGEKNHALGFYLQYNLWERRRKND